MLRRNKGTTRGLVEYLTSEEAATFLKKFRGTMLHRGYGSRSYRSFDSVLSFFKSKFKMDPSYPIQKAILNLLPFVGYAPRKVGRKVLTSPLLLKPSRKYVLMNEWLLRKQRGKTNVRGIKIKEVSRGFIDCVFKRGSVFNMKTDYTKKALQSRYVLMQRTRRKIKSRQFYRLKRIVMERVKRRLMRENK